jgi:hypothetical protein
VKETTFTSIGGKPYKKDYHLSNVFQKVLSRGLCEISLD